MAEMNATHIVSTCLYYCYFDGGWKEWGSYDYCTV